MEPAMPNLLRVHSPIPVKLAEVRLNKVIMNVVGLVLTIALCAAAVGVAWLLPHHAPVSDRDMTLMLLGFVVLVPFHEALHALAAIRWGGVTFKENIRFGVLWSALTPYCHCNVPISIKAYRRVALLPLWITGGIAVLALFVFPSFGLAILTGVTLAACVGDVWIYWKLRCFPADVLVQDHRSEVGCDIFQGGIPAPVA